MKFYKMQGAGNDFIFVEDLNSESLYKVNEDELSPLQTYNDSTPVKRLDAITSDVLILNVDGNTDDVALIVSVNAIILIAFLFMALFPSLCFNHKFSI